jgi:hypothetical protein
MAESMDLKKLFVLPEQFFAARERSVRRRDG